MNGQTGARYVVDETLDGGLRYTESFSSNDGDTSRECELRIGGEEHPVSALSLISFEQRFGRVSIACEGLGGVRTDPQQRNKGYIRRLMERALCGSAQRVDAAFLFGISMLYGKFGFASCLHGSEISLWVRCAEHLGTARSLTACPLETEDEGAVIAQYNRANSCRPWTRVRNDSDAARLLQAGTWRPRMDGIVFKDQTAIRGYALVDGYGYGWGKEPYRVREAVADSPEVAYSMIKSFCDAAAKRHLDTIFVEEPHDSVIGRALCHVGGKLSKQYRADGGGMGAILNRKKLIETLAPELERRTGDAVAPPGALTGLSDGGIVPDSRALVRLLIGYWSWTDARFDGTPEPDGYAEILHAWFPGGGTRVLPEPYAHQFDRY